MLVGTRVRTRFSLILGTRKNLGTIQLLIAACTNNPAISSFNADFCILFSDFNWLFHFLEL